MLETGIISTPFPSVIFTFGLAIEAIKELGGALNDFSNWIEWVDDEKIKGLCHFFTKILNLYHTFFFIHILGVDIFGRNNVIINEGDKCISVKFKIDLNTSLGNFRSC